MGTNLLNENFVQMASDVIIWIDITGEILFCNKATQKYYGYKKQELIGQKYTKLLPKEFSEEFTQIKEKILLNNSLEPIESQRVTKTNENFKVSVGYSAIKDKDDKILGISAIERKILACKEKDSQRIQIESALRWSQQQLDAFFTQSIDGFFFMMLDEPILWDDAAEKDALINYAFEHQRITRANDAILQQYRTTRENFIGLTPKEFFDHNITMGKKVWRNFFDQGRLHIQTDERRFDGSQMWVEGEYICLYNEVGKIVGHFGIQRDVTDKKLTEEKYKILADNMLDMVALHDPEGTFRYLSPSVHKLLGYQPEELLGQDPYSLFHPGDVQRIKEESHQLAEAGEEISNLEYRIRKKNGTYIWFSTNTKPIMNENGEVIMLQTVSRDVTERIATLQRLEEINFQKNKLFSVIGHDLRSPLSTCIGLLDILQTEGLNEDECRSYISLIKESTLSLQDLLDDLLIWANAQSDDITFECQVLNLSKEVDKILHHLSKAANAKKITITAEIDINQLVNTDQHMLATVIRNLISNGIKFTRVGGEIKISSLTREHEVIIYVSDNGIGMKKDTINRLFANSSYSSAGTKGEKGMGLGLRLCQDFVKILGGEIWVESEYGKGSTFSFSIKNTF